MPTWRLRRSACAWPTSAWPASRSSCSSTCSRATCRGFGNCVKTCCSPRPLPWRRPVPASPIRRPGPRPLRRPGWRPRTRHAEFGYGRRHGRDRPCAHDAAHLPARRASQLGRVPREPHAVRCGRLAAPRAHAGPVRHLSRLRHRRAPRAGAGAGRRPAGAAASDPVVFDAGAHEALVRRRARLRVGVWPRRHGAEWQGPVAGDDHRRPRGVLPPARLQPLLLRRLPAAVRADRHAVRHALPAAAGAARRPPRGHAGDRCPRAGLPRPARDLSRLAGTGGAGHVPDRGRAHRRPAPARPARERLMQHIPGWLTGSLIYLSAAVIVVPLSRAIGLGSILGYLAAGIVIGPWGLGLVSNVEDILHFAEFGVVLMLFLVGLELEPRRLWSLRRPIFGWGSAQVLGCAVLLFIVGALAGMPWRVSVVAALGLALSSTAIALQVMGERNLLPTSSGQAGFSILLFQDVAAIPILALLPLLGGMTDSGEAT